MVALVRMSDFSVDGPTTISCKITAIGSWGTTLSDRASVDVTGLTAAQVVTGLKNKIINQAAALGQTITAAQIYVFGAPQ